MLINPSLSNTGGDPCGSTGTAPSEGIALPDLEFEVTCDILNIRNSPGVEYSIVGQVYKGIPITSKNLISKSIWVEVKPGKWAHCNSMVSPL